MATSYQQPYTAEELSQSNGHLRVARRVGVEIAAISDLHRTLMADLDLTGNGISWWAGIVSVARSILIGDHLVGAAEAVPTNMIEAALHLQEVENQCDLLAERFRQHVRTGGDCRQLPTPGCPADELPMNWAPAHMGGCFRSVASTLDCLAVLIIGVTGLPLGVFRASWKPLLRELQGLAGGTALDSGAERQRSFATAFLACLEKSGPAGWLDWTLAMRNMVVHRPRITNIYQVRVRGGSSGLVFPRGVRIDLIETPLQLLAHPEVGQVEAFRAGGRVTDLLLSESATTTANGILRSAERLIAEASKLLIDVWRERRSQPALIKQPAVKQWPNLEPDDLTHFAGYDPGSLSVDPSALMSNESLMRRFQAASLMDNQIDRWPQLLEQARDTEG